MIPLDVLVAAGRPSGLEYRTDITMIPGSTLRIVFVGRYEGSGNQVAFRARPSGGEADAYVSAAGVPFVRNSRAELVNGIWRAYSNRLAPTGFFVGQNQTYGAQWVGPMRWVAFPTESLTSDQIEKILDQLSEGF